MGLGGFEFKQESYEHEQHSSGHGNGNGNGHGYGHTAPYCAPSRPSHYGNSGMAAQGYHLGGGYSAQNNSFLGHNNKHDHQFLLGNKHNMAGWSNGSHGGSKLSSYVQGAGHAMGAGMRHGGGGGGGGFYQKNEQSSANYEESSWSSGHGHGGGMASNRMMYGGGYPAAAWASKAL